MDLTMRGGQRRVLHIGGSAADALLIRDALARSASERYEVEWVEGLSTGLGRLTSNGVDAVLLDLRLPDCPGRDAIATLVRAAPAIAVLVVGGDEHDETAEQILLAGAQSYLCLSRLDGFWLPREISHAIERKRSQDAFSAEAERVGGALNSVGDALVRTDIGGRITYLNRAAEVLSGWCCAEAVGRLIEDVLQIVDPATREPAAHPMGRTTPGSQARIVSNSLLIRRDGSESSIEHSAGPLFDRLGLMVGLSIVLRDVSAARAMSVRMSHLASHDPLTDLPNRLLLTDRLTRALALARRHRRRLAVLFLDVDHFKDINDTYGHPLGDELLKAVGQGLTLCVRSSDTVSRQGGDEFIVVLSELERAEDAAMGAQKIVSALAGPHTVAGYELRITVSVGISVYPDDGDDAGTLIERADMALYHAKARGRDRFQFFEAALNARALERQAIVAGLRDGLDRREFTLLYQPKMNLRNGAVVGAEALIRWQHPERGMLDPAQFLPIAESCGLIRPIGRWVLHEACQQARAWQDAGLMPMPVSVNVSALELESPSFVDGVVDTLKATRLDPSHLEIELTESALVAQVDAANSTLRELQALGVQLAIDDFGTGCSNLSYLKAFPIDAVKVDKSFVQEIMSGSTAAHIVSAVIGMAKSLKHRVIAEGVETRDQLAFLQAEDCGEAQGYYFSRPLAAQHFARILENGANRIPGHVGPLATLSSPLSAG